MSRNGKLKVWLLAVLVLTVAGGGWFLFSQGRDNHGIQERNETMAASQQGVHQSAIGATTALETTKPNVEQDTGTLNITFRAIGLNQVSQGADQEIGFNVLNEIRSSPYFDSAKGSVVSPEVAFDNQAAKEATIASPGTFSFKIVAKLKRPLKL